MKLLISGTRGKSYTDDVYNEIIFYMARLPDELAKQDIIFIEGCCPNSADQIAEEVAKDCNIEVMHFPSTPGNYLQRNIEMVETCDRVLAFWDGFSYGTAHTIATATALGKPVEVIRV